MRYEVALQHFGEAGNAPMAALAANGIAACKQAQGDVAGAERIMHAALQTSLQAEPAGAAVILNILLDLTMLVARQRRWAEAELYLTATDGVASALFMPGMRAEALDSRGVAQLRLGKIAEAEQSLRDAIKIADKAEEHVHALAARKHLLDSSRSSEPRRGSARDRAGDRAIAAGASAVEAHAHRGLHERRAVHDRGRCPLPFSPIVERAYRAVNAPAQPRGSPARDAGAAPAGRVWRRRTAGRRRRPPSKRPTRRPDGA